MHIREQRRHGDNQSILLSVVGIRFDHSASAGTRLEQPTLVLVTSLRCVTTSPRTSEQICVPIFVLCRIWLYGIKAPPSAARTSPRVRRAPPGGGTDGLPLRSGRRPPGAPADDAVRRSAPPRPSST